MIDIRKIRADRNQVEASLRSKDPGISLNRIVELDEEVKKLKNEIEQLKAEKNSLSKKIGELKRTGQDTSALFNNLPDINQKIDGIEKVLKERSLEFENELLSMPNIPLGEAKVSLDPKDNVILKEYLDKPKFDFEIKNHMQLSELHNLFDFQRGAKVTGSGWPVYRDFGARLEWALIQFMMEVQRKNGFRQIMPPLLVNAQTMQASGQLPKFESQLFKITDKDHDFYLIPTSEVPINGLYMDEILSPAELPIKHFAYSPCFRREAGAAGANERGLIRTHQFNKVEMYAFTAPEESEEMFEVMCASAEEVLEKLGIHYRRMMLVTGDMSFSAAKTVDIEIWLPGQDRYYEVSSVSLCTDFQARRSNIRYRDKDGKLSFVHTLNGSGLATSRLMVGMLECNQLACGSINIPEALWPYLNGVTKLVAN